MKWEKHFPQCQTNKAADADGITAEYLKLGGQPVILFLQKLFNHIMSNAKYPETFKFGQISPIHKKGDKTTYNPDNYRKITIVSIIGKAFEKVYMLRTTPKILEVQSRLQFGFTEGTSPSIAAVLITEAICEAKIKKEPLYIAFLDTKKAFDVVNHASLLRKLYKIGVTGNLWLIARRMYSDMMAQVKWSGYTSGRFKSHQGLLQGGVSSASFHKTYENPLLLRLEHTETGLKIGTEYLGTITVADDKALLDTSPSGLQIAMNMATEYANDERYVNGTDKSQVYMVNPNQGDENHKWHLNHYPLNIAEQYNHLGIIRGGSKHSPGQDAVKKARKTAYALMGAGLHGVNGVNPLIGHKLWNIYIIPRCTYGLDTLNITTTEMDTILKFERKFLKNIMGLSDSTANVIPYILLGALPVDSQIHKKRLGLLGAIFRKEGSKEQTIAHRQLATKSIKENSWFQQTEKILHYYELPSSHTLLENTPSKEVWKHTVKMAIENKVTAVFKEEAKLRSSTKYINVDSYIIGTPHPVWTTVEVSTRDVRRAAVKAKILTGTYLLQANRAKFNQFTNDTCPLCEESAENYHHFILICPALNTQRVKYMKELEQLFKRNMVEEKWRYITERQEYLLQAIIDSTRLHWLIGSNLPPLIEPISRRFCFSLHLERSTLVALKAKNTKQKPRKKKQSTSTEKMVLLK